LLYHQKIAAVDFSIVVSIPYLSGSNLWHISTICKPEHLGSEKHLGIEQKLIIKNNNPSHTLKLQGSPAGASLFSAAKKVSKKPARLCH